MASTAEALPRSPFTADEGHGAGIHKSIPILPSTSASSSLAPPGDPMDVTPAATPTMGPPLSSPVGERNGTQPSTNGDTENSATTSSSATTTNGNPPPAIGAAAAAQQPKVVQTAFIHKLYNMLEDQSIQHLISWSNTNESFVMSPSSEFSKVLSSYFKHTNISSFVRQLNMYGFHKVSDVFHNGSPDSPLWEFKHGNGSFKRGDLVGLREIKRRASRHALIHRDSFSTGPKAPSAPPVGGPVEAMPDPVDARLNFLEQNIYELHSRLQRSDDSCTYMFQKYQVLQDSLLRCHQWNLELTNYIVQIVPDPQSQIVKDGKSRVLVLHEADGRFTYNESAAMMRDDIARQIETIRAGEDPQDPLQSARAPYFSNFAQDSNPPLSPRQVPQSDSRRPSLANINNPQPPSSFKAPVAPHLAISPRRYGSISTGSYSPSSARTPVHQQVPPPAPPTIQHPLSSSMSAHSPPANLLRRHTSADIRLHGWQAQPPAHSPYASGQNSTQWPSSPHRTPVGAGDQQIRDALAQYQLPRDPRQGGGSRQPTPPPEVNPGSSSANPDSGWSLPGARFPFKGVDNSYPPTRRSSMASNVHSLLNPAETVERDEDENDDRKRKRLG